MTEITSRRAARSSRRGRTSVTGVLGEILITVGVVVLMYVVWQMWVGDMIIGAESNKAGTSLSEEWDAEAKKNPTSEETSDPSSQFNTVIAEPPAVDAPGSAEDFGVLYIPRLGITFPIAGGTTTWESLDLGKVGYYLDTGLPGQAGNFALAGHRGSHGAPFMNLPQLQVGDAIVVKTQDGWYTYRYRNMEYVAPTAVEVLLPTPQNAGAGTTGSFITLTTCSPRYGSAERLIAYGVFESFTPTTPDGKSPASLVLAEAS